MKSKIITTLLIAALFVMGSVLYAQMYYTGSGSEAVENNGKEWIDRELPPAIIFFSDNSGQAEVKADISSLIENKNHPEMVMKNDPANFADFRMNLDKKQIAEELYSGKVFSSTGFLKINGIAEKVTARYLLEPAGDIENGFTISLIIRLNPADFHITIKEEAANTPLLLKITSGIVNEI